VTAACEIGVPAVVIAACPGGRIATGAVFEQRLTGLVPTVADRLLLLTAQNVVIYDTQNEDAYGMQVQLVRTRTLDQATAFEGMIQLGGQPYLASGVGLGSRRNPLGASRLVLIQTTASINALAVQSLLPGFVEAGLLALAVALALGLIVGGGVSVSGSVSSVAPSLHVNGNLLVDSSGKTVSIRGVNRSGTNASGSGNTWGRRWLA